MTLENIGDLRIELESKIAFQEKSIGDLNEAVVDQMRTIMDLRKRIEMLEKIVLGINQRLEGLAENPPIEKPPHY